MAEPKVIPGMFRREHESLEDDYFFEQDRKLIKERRQMLDPQRQDRAARASSQPHWMRCPKCGGDMTETDLSGVLVEQCRSCGGVHFDAGELETFVRAISDESSSGLWPRIRRALGGANTRWRP